MPIGLSIRQPWTELILRGQKTIEVRTWPTRHRGELWLHAGATPERKALGRFGMTADRLPRGALVGRCELRDCVEFTAETWKRWRDQHLNDGPLEERRYAWFVENPIRMPPLLMKGRLGLMRLDLPAGSIR